MEKELKYKLDNAIQNYVDIFCKKHEFQFDFWVANETGTIGTFGDLYIDFSTIRYDLENQVPEEYFMEWYDEVLDAGLGDKSFINYKSFVMNHD